MQDLQHDAPALGMYGAGDRSVQGEIRTVIQHGCVFFHAALEVGREPAGEDQRSFAAGARAEELGEPLVRSIECFQPRVHGTHDHAVAQLQKPEVVGGKQVRKMSHLDFIEYDDRRLRPVRLMPGGRAAGPCVRLAGCCGTWDAWVP